MTKLFIVESQSAPEGLTPAGAWTPVGEADTLDEAKALVVATNAKGWQYARVAANIEMVEALRVESARHPHAGVFFTAGADIRAGAQLEIDQTTGRLVPRKT